MESECDDDVGDGVGGEHPKLWPWTQGPKFCPARAYTCDRMRESGGDWQQEKNKIEEEEEEETGGWRGGSRTGSGGPARSFENRVEKRVQF